MGTNIIFVLRYTGKYELQYCTITYNSFRTFITRSDVYSFWLKSYPHLTAFTCITCRTIVLQFKQLFLYQNNTHTVFYYKCTIKKINTIQCYVKCIYIIQLYTGTICTKKVCHNTHLIGFLNRPFYIKLIWIHNIIIKDNEDF